MRVNALGKLHCYAQLVGDEGMAPLTHQRNIQEHWAIQGMTQALRALIAK